MRHLGFIFCIALLLVTAGCGKSKEDSNPKTAPKQPEERVLSPVFESAKQCLSECKTVWSKKNGTVISEIEAALPVIFTDFIADDSRRNAYLELIKLLPEKFWPIGVLQESDAPGEVKSTYGSYTKDIPPLLGGLSNVVDYHGDRFYVYTDVYYFRSVDAVTGNMTIAVNPVSGEMAVFLQSGRDIDEYHIRGSDSIKPVLIAHRVLADLEFSDFDLFYAKKDKDSDDGYESKPVRLPVRHRLNEAVERIVLFNDVLGSTGDAVQVPSPENSQNAKRVRAESTWYGISQGNDKCIVSPMSPADKIKVIREAGVTPTIRSSGGDQKPTYVEMSVEDALYVQTWRFWKHQADCEAALPNDADLDAYR